MAPQFAPEQGPHVHLGLQVMPGTDPGAEGCQRLAAVLPEEGELGRSRETWRGTSIGGRCLRCRFLSAHLQRKHMVWERQCEVPDRHSTVFTSCLPREELSKISASPPWPKIVPG